MIKTLLELAMKRSPIKVWRHSRSEIVRFGLTIGITAVTFHAVLCLLRRIGKSRGVRFALNMGRKLAMIIAAMVASLPLLYGLQAGELNLLKLIFYPLAFRCFVDKMIELGWLKTFKHGDILAYVLVNLFVAFTYTQERQSCPPSLFNMVEVYSQMGKPEFRL
jgi:hypothetical protein